MLIPHHFNGKYKWGDSRFKTGKNIDVCTLAYSKGTKYLVGPLLTNGLDTVKRYLITPE